AFTRGTSTSSRPRVPDDGCIRRHGATLLSVGIAPKRPAAGGAASKATLHSRILRQHFRGNASSSTLPLTLGCLLATKLAISLTQAGWGRLTFIAGEARLSAWMVEHARVCWVKSEQAWALEEALIECISLPLNLIRIIITRFT